MGRKLFVGGLAWATNDESLRKAFEKFGEVVSASVIMDRESGRSRGFGFVVYGEDAHAQAAVDAMQGADVDGRRIRVDLATEGPGGGGGPRPGGFGGSGPRPGGGYGGGGGGYGGGPGGGGGGYGGGGGGYGPGGGGGGYGPGGGGGGYGPGGGGGGGYGPGGGGGGYGGGGYGGGGGGGYGGPRRDGPAYPQVERRGAPGERRDWPGQGPAPVEPPPPLWEGEEGEGKDRTTRRRTEKKKKEVFRTAKVDEDRPRGGAKRAPKPDPDDWWEEE